MFITSKRSGYDRNDQQTASGLFLILVQPHYSSTKYPTIENVCSDCGRDRQAHEVSAAMPIPTCLKHGVIARLRQRAASVEPTDADFIEAPVTDCPECEAHESAMKLAGCTFYHPASITYPIRAIVRFVSMSQCGQYMMGRARVKGESIILSGAYGSDGLPTMVSDKVYDVATPLPDVLYEAWKNGKGWNSAGSEAQAMREWALANLKLLRNETIIKS